MIDLCSELEADDRHIAICVGIFGIFVSSNVTRQTHQLDTCRTIIKAQNLKLNKHRIHAIAGIGLNQMDTPDENNTTLRSKLLALPGVTRVERTPATPSMGKWFIFTDNDHEEASRQALEANLAPLFYAQSL